MKSSCNTEAKICAAFHHSFKQSHQTELVGGAAEPLYQPQLGKQLARVYYREDYCSSALHEIAHWCLAGSKRRQQLDYGYWYEPKRDVAGQREFESVEVKPQALEWVFHCALNLRFRVSADNLALVQHDTSAFEAEVLAMVASYLDKDLPDRAGRFALALAGQATQHLNISNYQSTP